MKKVVDKGLRMKRRLVRVQLKADAPTRTQQHMKDHVDINNILKRYRNNGELPTMIKNNPQYGDFSDPKTYHEALNTVVHAQEQFAGLPSHVRERFYNDPQYFLEFATDLKNASEMVAMGLATKREQSNERDIIESQKTIPEGSKKPVKSEESKNA